MALWSRTKQMMIRRSVDMSKVASADPRVAQASLALSGQQHAQIRRKMAERFATVVERMTDAESGKTTSHILRTKPAAEAAIRLGLMEVASIWLYQRINRERATLHSYGANYAYDPASDSFAADLAEMRDAAGRSIQCQRLDWGACGLGSTALLVQVLGDRLSYQSLDPDKIWIAFADEIEDVETGVRPTNRREIDEASCVVVALAGTDDKARGKYAAIYGASAKYPRGRQVTYYATSWNQVPDVGSPDASDYADDSGIANPLTAWKQRQGDATLPEYPVITWVGEPIAAPTLMPVSLGLWEQCAEIDLSMSRVLMSGLKGARGLFEIHREMGASLVLPENADEGVVVTEQGLTLKHHPSTGTAPKSAMEIIDAIALHTAASYGVPAYKMGINSQAQAPSGVALALLNQPLAEERQRRAELNRSQMARLFAVEMALVSSVEGSPVGAGVRETWTPKEVSQITDPTAEAMAQETWQRLGIASVERTAMALVDGIETVEQARNFVAEVRTETQPAAASPAPVAQTTQTTPRIFAARRG